LRIDLSYNIKTENGWRLYDNPLPAVWAGQQARECQKRILAGLTIDSFDISRTGGYPSRVVVAGKSSQVADWVLAIRHIKDNYTDTLRFERSTIPRWVYTFKDDGLYRLSLTASNAETAVSLRQEVQGRALATDSSLWFWAQPATLKPDFYEQQPKPGDTIELHLLQGEKQGVNLCLLSSYNTKARISFTGQHTRMALYRTGYMDTRQPGRYHNVDPYHRIPVEGWLPDPLLPVDSTGHHLAQSRVEPFHAELAMRTDSPGVYYEEFQVRTEGHSKGIVVRIEQHAVRLPESPLLKTAFSVYGVSKAIYPERYREMHRHTLETLWEHGISPDLLYRGGGHITLDEIDMYMQITEGQTYSNLYYVYENNADTLSEYLPELHRLVDTLQARGLRQQFYFYTFDESHNTEEFLKFREVNQALQKEFPDIETITTAIFYPYPKLKEMVAGMDHYCPLTRAFDRHGLDANEYDWWYICNQPAPPYANWFIESRAIEPRILMWQSWQYDMEGFLYWVANRWRDQGPVTDDEFPMMRTRPHDYRTVNGDGVLLYPGQNGILPSLRLKNIRDGIEDYSLLRMAEEKLGRAAVAAIVEKISRSVSDYESGPQKLNEARLELIRLLEGTE
jgi:hypothetical protein